MNDPLLTPTENQHDIKAELSTLPEIAPAQDRLEQVLAQVAAQRAAKAANVAEVRTPRRAWLPLLAAAVSVVALLSWVGDVRPPLSPLADVETSSVSESPSEIALLRWQSQVLERQMHALRDDRGSLSQLDALSVAELSLAALDAQLQSHDEVSSEDLLSQQRALWRERVAVLQAVNQGQYRPALYAID